MRTFSLVRKRSLLLIVLIKLIVTRQQVPDRFIWKMLDVRNAVLLWK